MSCVAKSSDAFLSCFERESMTTNQDANKDEIEAQSTSSDKRLIEIYEFGDSNDDSLRGTSSNSPNLGNNGDETQENSMNLSECEATESIIVSSDENEMIIEAEDENRTYRKQNHHTMGKPGSPQDKTGKDQQYQPKA
ncbi:hypothetical protein RDI58_028995 [Solanum bulbocastanum]|uniref:Uncharacterized protein n=1 Tax=Solanum bulbocastanum TaxID=147425 RepID=A0AAN8XZZ6_SOLBU